MSSTSSGASADSLASRLNITALNDITNRNITSEDIFMLARAFGYNLEAGQTI